MKTITITLSDEEYSAMAARVESVEEWIQTAAKNKARNCIDWVVQEDHGLVPNKQTVEAKISIIQNSPPKTRIDRDKEKVAMEKGE